MASGKQRHGLGRGLGALIVNTDTERQSAEERASATGNTGVFALDVARIEPNPRQPRTEFEENSLRELAASIREHGVIQPLIVTESLDKPDRFWLVAGERRWRAAQMAKVKQVPVLVREATSQQLLEWALVENVQRADLNPLEEATAYLALMQDFSLTQAQVAEKVGKSRSAVANTVRLLQLPEVVQQAILAHRISAGHARALLSLPEESLLQDTFERVLAHDLSVRQTETLVKRMLDRNEATPQQEEPDHLPPDSHHEFLENSFRSALGTRVSLNRNSDGTGRLIVHFYSDEDLDHIFRIIARKYE